MPRGKRSGPRIDKSVLTIGEPPRRHDPAYRKSAKGRPCDCCGGNNETVVLAHIATKTNSGMGLKPDDAESLFLCHACHADLDGSDRRSDWLVFNILIPDRRRAYRMWKEAT